MRVRQASSLPTAHANLDPRSNRPIPSPGWASINRNARASISRNGGRDQTGISMPTNAQATRAGNRIGHHSTGHNPRHSAWPMAAHFGLLLATQS